MKSFRWLAQALIFGVCDLPEGLVGWLAQTLILGVSDLPKGLVAAPARQQKAAPLTNRSALRWLAGALLKITPCASFPRKRKSAGVGPRFRGGDEGGDSHSLGRAGGPSKLRRH